ncbi:MAG: autotransporter outer membrane beta-barrel domain-containing protein [Rhodospirillaceae bacterium]|nr:autotransporter outer membrane beta-barrel domain-containing protein [Rhodospirillaceae bacterium]
MTRYSAEFSSSGLGGLKKGAAAWAHFLGVEGGRRFGLDGGKTTLAARAWLHRSGVSMGRFRDAAGSRLSVGGSNRLRIGAGVAAETRLTGRVSRKTAAPPKREDGLTLHGSLGAEQTLGGGTEITVSRETLNSEAKATRLRIGAGGTWRWGGMALSGTLAADGLVSGDTAYAARLDLRVRF